MKQISEEDLLTRLAAMAAEHDPVLRVVEKRRNPQTMDYELVLAKGLYSDNLIIPHRMVEGWLDQNDRSYEAAIRYLISEATDRLDERDYRIKEDQAFWDWTGDKR